MTETKLQGLVDRQEITELIYRYCRSVDRIDKELGYSIWSKGGVADYGDFYRGDGCGVIDLICEQHQKMLIHTHQMSNIIIKLDGERAASESYVTANLRMNRDDKVIQMTVFSRYVDEWSRCDGRWGIKKRLTIREFDEVREVTPLSQLEVVGSRDHNDPSYKAFLNLCC